jgi:hypothetical protein
MFNFIKIWPIKNVLKKKFTNDKRQINSVAMFIMWLLALKIIIIIFLIQKDN